MIPLYDNVPSRRRPVVTLTLIAINTMVFLYELAQSQPGLTSMVYEYGVVPERYTGGGGVVASMAAGGWIPILTSMFMHGGWMHLIGNMWYLWLFGDNVEDLMGPARFLTFYLVCGFIASMTHIWLNAYSTIPSIGASGAIAGVLGAYLVAFPGARVLTLVPIFYFIQTIELPALVLLGFWFVMQFLSGTAAIVVSSQTTGGVAYWAHVGGFVAGMLLVKLFAGKPQRYGPRWE